jgi:hypothetical protein
MRYGKAVSAAVALALVAVLAAGCSKDTQKDDRIKELEQKVTELEGRAKDYEVQIAQVKADAGQAATDHATETQRLTDVLQARLMRTGKLSPLEIQPEVDQENEWLRVTGRHTYTLKGYSAAKAVRFYISDFGPMAREELLGAGTRTTGGWFWSGEIPRGDTSLTVEVETTDGTRFWAAVAPIRSAGK